MSNENEIIIDLDKSEDIAIFEEAQSRIQQRAWDEIMDKIKKFTEAAPSCRNHDDHFDIYYPRKQSTISVFGRRGEGKTTFILNVLEHFKPKSRCPHEGNNQQQREANRRAIKKNGKDNVYPLQIIDPTLIESKEHPFLHIISNIQEICQHKYRNDQDNCNYQTWMKSLCKLARGLRLLAEIENPDTTDKWEDPQYVVEEGLQNATSGRHLERNFNDFLRYSLNLLDADVFLLAFDDIDTNFEKGWDILETIRKFLTSPNLLVILSGDLELYIKMIRKHQWSMLGSLVDREDGINWKDMVSNLEEQYLLKILNNKNRIHLTTVNELLNDDNYKLKIKLPPSEKSETEPISLKEYIDEKTNRLFFIERNKDIITYRTLLCSQPIRTQLQILRSMSKNDDTSFYKELLQIFLSTLDSEGVNPEHLNLADDNVALSQLACYLTDLNAWNQGFSLRPTVQKSRRDLLWLIMGCIYSKNLQKNPGDYFDYFIKIGLAHHTISAAPNQAKHYMDFFGLRYGYEGIYVARKMLGVLRRPNDEPLGFGTFQVHTKMPAYNVSTEDWERLAEHGGSFYKIEAQIEEHFNTIEDLDTRITSGNKAFATLPFSMISDLQNKNSTVLSFFNLLSSISHILRPSYEENQIENQLATISQLKSYPLHAGNNTKAETQESGNNNNDNNDNNDTPYTRDVDTHIIELLKKWKEQSKNLSPIPIYILTKIWEKTNYSLKRVAEYMPSSKQYAGNCLHRFCIVFLNATLFELSINNSQLNSSNPTGEDDIFTQNLNNYKGKLPDLFSWIWACPFWGFYLNPKESNENKRDTTWELYLEHSRKQLSPRTNKDSFRSKFKVIYKKGTAERHFSNMHPLLNSLSSKNTQKHIKQTSSDDDLTTPIYKLIPNKHKNLTQYHQGAATKILQYYKDIISAAENENEKADLVLEILNKHFSKRKTPITRSDKKADEWIQACLKAIEA